LLLLLLLLLTMMMTVTLVRWNVLEELEVERCNYRKVTATSTCSAVGASARTDPSRLPTAPAVTYIR